ncbi:DUF4249 family protein [Flavitalea sp. BT771]|uniref:DUF4249 family protein n=1 Tax=Flavitalea sp. BT771 TaxID=3063329 RepID=UPI0026E426F2|nr:DUF4249 family protein [Flavitalea sp. BT771]MDO6429358.1 DUF4249 family protein [Flavitalea sp. BT771]MDV6218514.1 DUF4249 family protein [Flavitalea sp. BT771]
MNKQCYFFLCAFFVFFAGCTRDFPITKGKISPTYVIEGRISNLRGAYYVRITKAQDLASSYVRDTMGLDYAEGVTGARVIISDDRGTADTLKPADALPSRREYFYRNDKIDSEWMPNEHYEFTTARGYYGTTKITGIPGHTYHLQVYIGNGQFEASAYMPLNAPPVDSAAIGKDMVTDAFMSNGNPVFTWFNEPQDEVNYYLLQAANINGYTYDRTDLLYNTNAAFPYEILDEKTLPPYVNGLEIQAIMADYMYRKSPRYYPIAFQGTSVQVRLFSIDRNTHEYFKTLEKQFLNDGNVYKPAPASAAGNISGGALGLFWAPNISYKLVLR